jgi:hypothetical protein
MDFATLLNGCFAGHQTLQGFVAFRTALQQAAQVPPRRQPTHGADPKAGTPVENAYPVISGVGLHEPSVDDEILAGDVARALRAEENAQ